MSLVALPPEIFAQILDLLLSAHQARLFKTGDSRMQRLLANTPRTCSLTLANRRCDSVAISVLKTASDIRSDGSFLFHVVTNVERRTTMAFWNIRSMEIITSPLAPLAEQYRSVDLSAFGRLETFSHSGAYFHDPITLPKSITRVDIQTFSSEPIRDLSEMVNLTSLKLSANCQEEDRFLANISWPTSLLSLTLDIREAETVGRLDSLPSTLTELSLGSGLEEVPFTGLPGQLVRLESLNLRFRRTPIPPNLRLPQSLTRLYIAEVEPMAPNSIVACLESIPPHVTDFSFDELAGFFDMDSVTVAYRTLLPRLSTLASLEKAICASFMRYNKARHSELTALYVKNLARFGLDHRYLDLLIGAGDHLDISSRFNMLYDSKVPQSYIDAFLDGVYKMTVFSYVVAVYGNDESMKFADWAFECARAQRLELYDESGIGGSCAQPLPDNVCKRVRRLHVNVIDTTPLSTLFSRPMPMLDSIELSLYSSDFSKPLDDIANALYNCRHNLPRLETLDHDTTGRFDNASISLLAEMRLYNMGRRSDFSYAVSPPEHVLKRYPHLQPRPVKVE